MKPFCYLLIVLLIFGAACGGHNRPVAAPSATDQDKKNDIMISGKNQVIFVDQALEQELRVVKFKAGRNDMGMGVVKVQLQPTGEESIAVDIKCRFICKDDEIEDTPWEPKVLKKHEVTPVEFTSLKPEVLIFNVYVRYNK